MFGRSTSSKQLDASYARHATGGGGVGANVACTILSEIRGRPVPVERVNLLLQQYDADGDGKLLLDELQRLNTYLDRGHNVRDELDSVYEIVAKQRQDIEALQSVNRDAELASQMSNLGLRVAPAASGERRGSGQAIPAAANVSLSPPNPPTFEGSSGGWPAGVVAAAAAAAAASQPAGGPPGRSTSAKGFRVSGAGVAAANGVYERDGEYNGAALFKKGELWLLQYTLPSGNRWWYIADCHQLDRDDGDLYRVRCDDGLPPLTGWLKARDGRLPAPELTAVEGEAEWVAETWIQSLGMEKVVAEATFAPLVERLGRSSTSEEALAFARALGRSASINELHALLSNSSLVERLAHTLHDGIMALSVARAATAKELHGKFVTEGAFSLAYGGLSTFFGGLSKVIGPPSPLLDEAILSEHTRAADSLSAFVTSNYAVDTTSEVEYWFVVDPSGSKLQEIGSAHWPKEAHLEWDEAFQELARRARPLSDFEPARRKLNTKLCALGEPSILVAELTCGRLYTGPMFVKYNSVLRGSSEAARPAATQHMRELCADNRYVTTLHTINSLIVKAGKLTKADKVYRGVSGAVLPAEFWTANEYGVKGGIDAAFMSTTLDRNVATVYAGGGGVGLVFEIQQGMLSRGANLSWLSQYPHEREILVRDPPSILARPSNLDVPFLQPTSTRELRHPRLQFPPLTGLEVQSTRVDGGTLVVEVRLSVNLNALTIEQVVAKMQASQLALIDVLADEFAGAQAPARPLRSLNSLRRTNSNREPSWFNVASNYEHAVTETFAVRAHAIGQMSRPESWEAETDEPAKLASRMRQVALLCARSGEHTRAAELVLLAHCTAPALTATVRPLVAAAGTAAGAVIAALTAEGRARVQARIEAASALVLEGLSEPWPRTLVDVLSGGAAEKDDGEAAAAATWLGMLVQTLLSGSGPSSFGGAAAATSSESGRSRAISGGAGHVDWALWSARMRPGAAVLVSMTEPARKWQSATVVHEDESDNVTVQRHGLTQGREVVPRRRALLVGEGGMGALLREAAATGYRFLVDSLLRAGVSVFEADSLANTALHMAAAGGHAEVCARLQVAGSQPKYRNRRDKSAIHLAIEGGHGAVKRLFEPTLSDRACRVDAGASLTALMRAARAGDLDTTLTELHGGAANSIDARSEDGCSALSLAAEEGHVEVASALLDARADPNAVQDSSAAHERFTPLMLAAIGDHPAVIEVLLRRRADPCLYLSDSTSALMLAARSGAAAAVEVLLGQPEVVAQIDQTITQAPPDGSPHKESAVTRGFTALFMACRFGHAEAVRLLVGARASCEATNALGYTALQYACEFGHQGALNAMVSLGANVNHRAGRDGWHALFDACMNGHEELVQILCAADADVNATRATTGATATFFAAQNGHAPCVRTMCMAGAKLETVNNKVETLLNAATKGSHLDCQRLPMDRR